MPQQHLALGLLLLAASGLVAAAPESMTELFASDSTTNDRVGYASAISGDGLYALAGGRNNVAGANPGAVYVFHRTGDAWAQQQKLVDANGEDGDNFGASRKAVAVNADGTYAIVGSYNQDSNKGAAHIFTRSGSTWTQGAKLVSNNPSSQRFGWAVAISAGGQYAAVGEYQSDVGFSNAGAAHVFVRTGSSWSHQQRILSSVAGATQYFGFSVSLSSDGSRVAIGEYRGGVSSQGAAEVHTRSGSTWSLEQRFVLATAANAYSGRDVALNAGGDYLAVGGYRDTSVGGIASAGAVYVLTRSGTTWTQQAKLDAGDSVQASSNFGIHIDISDDGTRVAVAAAYEDTDATNQGAVYVFDRTDATWTRTERLVPLNGGVNTYFGMSFRMSGATGAYIAAGSYMHPGGLSNEGYLTIVKLPGTSDTVPPTFSSPPALSAASTPAAVEVEATSDEDGRLYCCAYRAGGESFSAAEVVAGAGTPAPDVCHDVAAAAGAPAQVPLAGLGADGARLFDIWCVAEDDAPAEKRRVQPRGRARVLANAGEPYEIAGVFAGACLAGDAPAFDVAGSTVSGDSLALRWASSRHYAESRLAFRDAPLDADCSMQALLATGAQPAEDEWAYAADAASCGAEWTFTRPLAETLGACGFAEVVSGGDPAFTEYRATVDVTTVESVGSVLGAAATRTTQSATEFGVRLPNAVSVDASVSAFGSAIDLARLSRQQVNAETRAFAFSLATSVQWPYYLEEVSASSSGGAGAEFLGAAPAVVGGSGGACAGAAEPDACTQTFEITARAGPAECAVDTEVTVTFAVRCRAAFGGACVAPAPGTASATFRVKTDSSMCASVVEVATVTPTLSTHATEAARDAGGAEAVDFVLQTTLFGRVALAAEGGVQTQSVTLRELQIVSACEAPCVTTRTPTDDAGAALAAYQFATTPGGAGEPHADFEFTLSTASVNFDGGVVATGQTTVTLVATVDVVYTPASGQAAVTRRVTAVLDGGAAAASEQTARASTQFGVSSDASAPSGSSSSSAASLPVAGVAGAAFAVAVVAVAAVVVRRKRGAAAAKKQQREQHAAAAARSSSAASVQLDVAPAGPEAGATAAVPALSLAGVASAYEGF